jgi:succinyl-CoA synthetase beta subunit
MLGHKLTTKQTGAEGQLVSKVLVNASLEIEKEYYFAVMMDRACGGPVIIVSKEGGVDIEEVAEKHPEAIIKASCGVPSACSIPSPVLPLRFSMPSCHILRC